MTSTTKKGKKGEIKVSYQTYVGISEVADKVDVLSTQEYINVINELSVAEGKGVVFTDADVGAIGTGTDWQDEIFRTSY